MKNIAFACMIVLVATGAGPVHADELTIACDAKEADDPLDEPLNGVQYHYCGYSSSLGMHLVEKNDHGYFTGVLLDHRTGKRLEGGLHVSFSPDQKRYFSSSQADGVDGEDWVVRSRDGKTL